MAIVSAADLESRFQENDAPSSADFAAVFDSFLHKVSAAGTALAVRSLGAGTVGSALFSTATTAAARAQLGNISSAAAVGQEVYDAATTASAQTVIGGGAVGRHLFEAITTASARRDLDLNVATTAQMSAPTNTSSAFITPGLQQYHPLMPKAWVNFNGTGTISVRDSWNVASIGDLGAGLYRVTWGSAFPDKGYAITGFIKGITDNGNAFNIIASANSFAAGDVQLVAVSGVGTPTNFDTSVASVWAIDR